MESVIRVATINIYNDRSRWAERRELLVRGLAEQSLDLIALQEVTDPLGISTAHWLADELGGYTVRVSPKTGLSRRREGIAVLSRLPVERDEILNLRTQERTAQLVQVRCGGQSVVLVNTHLIWQPWAHEARVRQVERILAWVGKLDPDAAVIICGDFNSAPDAPAMDLLRQSYASAHEACHGREPAYTCPTPLIMGPNLRGAVTRGLLRLVSNRPGETWQRTLDYIFVGQGIRVMDCHAIFDNPAPGDPTLYASDHLGLAAALEVGV